MASSLKTMNQVRKPVGQAASKSKQAQKAVEKTVSKPEKAQTVQPMAVADVKPEQESAKKVIELKKELPETVEVSDALPSAEDQAKKVNTAETPEDAIMQSEAVTPDLDNAVIPKKKTAKKAAPRAARQAGKKK